MQKTMKFALKKKILFPRKLI